MRIEKRGLSLLEILVATLILALVMTGLASLFSASQRLTLHTRSRMHSAEIGKLFLDALNTQVRQDTWLNNCLGSNAAAGCPGPETVNGILYTPAWAVAPVPNVNPNFALQSVTLTIRWLEPQ